MTFAVFLESNNITLLSKRIADSINSNIAQEEMGAKKTAIFQYVSVFRNNEAYLKRITSTFSEILKGDPSMFPTYGEILDAQRWGWLVNESAINYLIGSLTQTISSETSNKLEIIKTVLIDGTLSQKTNDAYVTKIIPFFASADLPVLQYWLQALSGALSNITPDQLSSLVAALDARFANLIVVRYGQQGNVSADAIKCYQKYLDVAKEIYQIRQDPKAAAWIKYFVNTQVNTTVMGHASKVCGEIIENAPAGNWEFAQVLVDKGVSPQTAPIKTEFAESMNKMLLKTSEGVGLSEAQIQKILAHYLALAKTNEEIGKAAKSWLVNISQNMFIKTKLTEQIAQEGDMAQRLKMLSLIKGIDAGIYNSFAGRILNELNSEQIIHHKDMIGAIAEDSGLLSDENKNLFVDKMFPILSEVNNEKRCFAVNVLAKMQNIPSVKFKKLKSVIDDISIEDIPEETLAGFKALKELIK